MTGRSCVAERGTLRAADLFVECPVAVLAY
jgi:hypothetical protein